MSTRTSIKSPSRIRARPKRAKVLIPLPGPVNASELEDAVLTAGAVVGTETAVVATAVVVGDDVVGGGLVVVAPGDVVVVGVVVGAVVGATVVVAPPVVVVGPAAGVVTIGVVVGDVGVVVVEVVGVVEVEVDVVVGMTTVVPVVGGDAAATAITGAMALAVGVETVMPDGVTESLGYAVQVSDKLLPATESVRLAEESSSIVTAPVVAVNPVTVAGVDGSDRDTPASGMGLGKGTLKSRGPSGVVAGVAPLASIWAVAEPVRVGDTAAAAEAKELGRFTTVW
jgi:hypothetical protein